MKIFIREIGDREKELVFSELDPWILQAIEEIEETPLGLPSTKLHPIQVSFSHQRLDSVIVIKGKIQAPIGVLCSRCGRSFPLACSTHFQTLFTEDSSLIPALNDDNSHHKITLGDSSDFEISFLDKDFIDLSDILKEQLLLQIPYQPLCKEGCLGVCATCGNDLNIGPCSCKPLQDGTKSPFAVLKEIV